MQHPGPFGSLFGIWVLDFIFYIKVATVMAPGIQPLTGALGSVGCQLFMLLEFDAEFNGH
jgi:hypothetical protein